MNYRYKLDTSSKKYRCTKCNKNTLVKFIDTKTGKLLNENFGRCDRETKCGFFNSPKSNFRKENNNFKYEKPYPISYHDYNLLVRTNRNYKDNNFVQFLKSLFGEKKTIEVIKKYSIGTSKHWNGANVFWQIDNNLKVRHGKIMLYDVKTGKRQKNEFGKAYITSVRSVLKLKDYNLEQCLFGLHLINETKNKSIAIVESEKTAILMSLYKPQYVWLATGSKRGFKYEYLKPLRNYRIIGFPDKSEYQDWSNKAIELNNLSFHISISEWLEKKDCIKGTDLADILIKEKRYNNSAEVISKVNEAKPTKLINTPSEIIAKKMSKKNPEILKLISLFQLSDNNGIEIKI